MRFVSWMCLCEMIVLESYKTSFEAFMKLSEELKESLKLSVLVSPNPDAASRWATCSFHQDEMIRRVWWIKEAQ